MSVDNGDGGVLVSHEVDQLALATPIEFLLYDAPVSKIPCISLTCPIYSSVRSLDFVMPSFQELLPNRLTL